MITPKNSQYQIQQKTDPHPSLQIQGNNLQHKSIENKTPICSTLNLYFMKPTAVADKKNIQIRNNCHRHIISVKDYAEMKISKMEIKEPWKMRVL